MTGISLSSIAGGIIYLSTVKLADELLKEETQPPTPVPIPGYEHLGKTMPYNEAKKTDGRIPRRDTSTSFVGTENSERIQDKYK